MPSKSARLRGEPKRPDRPRIDPSWQAVALPGPEQGGAAFLADEVFSPDHSALLFAALSDELAWTQRDILMFGKPVRQPRLVAYHGDAGASYRYSGTVYQPQPWTNSLRQVRKRVEDLVGLPFNSVLCNLYRSGEDSMGWHSDDEPELGPDPVIASVSFGATRRMRLRRRKRPANEPSTGLNLRAGSLFLMTGELQRLYQHQIPKVTGATGVAARLNLTFRRVRKGFSSHAGIA